MARTYQLSRVAADALSRILQSSSIAAGPDLLDAVLLKLELQERLTVSEIILRRDLRRIPEEVRQSLSLSVASVNGQARGSYGRKQTLISTHFLWLGLVGALLLTPDAFPHGGGLDSLGCHHDRRRGGYHCHRGPLAGRSFSSKAEAEKELQNQQKKESSKPSQQSLNQYQWRTVERVIDGDTLVLAGGERVRLIGVDTPETVDPRRPVQYFGKEASAFTRRMAEGKRVRLEYDQDRVDRYGRTLAYVYLENGTFVNAEIIKQGCGFAYTQYPFRYLEEFRRYEREAREAQRGLWKQEH